jgi:hypothetical protein
MAESGLDGFMDLCWGRTGRAEAAGVLSGNVATEKDQEDSSAENQGFVYTARLTLRVLLVLPLPVVHFLGSTTENLLSGDAPVRNGREIGNHQRRFSHGA